MAKKTKKSNAKPANAGGSSKRDKAPMASKQLLANKSFGQNFLKNPGILDKIMDAADVKPSDCVFEIGPGTGNLTSRLLRSAKQVIAQEIDPRMVAAVQKRAQAEGTVNKLTINQGDCLKANWPPFHCCVANLPYQISSPFTFKLLAHASRWRCAVIMFQKEFAERLVAQTGESHYGRLALNCQLFAKVQRVCKVDRGSFTPPPKVDSMVVKFTPAEKPVDVDFREWDGLLRICFSRKRKTLAASFRPKTMSKVLEQNFRTFCSLRGIQNPEELIKQEVQAWKQKKAAKAAEDAAKEAEEEEDEDEDEDSEEPWEITHATAFVPSEAQDDAMEDSDDDMAGGAAATGAAAGGGKSWRRTFHQYILSILGDLSSKRAISLDMSGFLGLLLAFNKKGIHFSNVTGQKKDNETALLEAAEARDVDMED